MGLVSGAHPRSRGENPQYRSVPGTLAGSSPLTRGKHPDVRAGRRRSGLIPAHAGKTCSQVIGEPNDRAHPRSRGENRATPRLARVSSGSSPLTRGKRGDGSEPWAARRLIPAHAGKTGSRRASHATDRAHPRSRGENDILQITNALKQGSSPLTRGKPGDLGNHQRRGGLIPAHAGKTPPKRTAPLCGRAHPRSRGENYVYVT